MKNLEIKSNREEWIFNYLEGNLNNTDRILFENQLITDSNLKIELGKWESTYLSHPPEVDYDLKNTLLQKDSFLKKYGYLSLVIVLFSIGLGWQLTEPLNDSITPKKDGIIKQLPPNGEHIINQEQSFITTAVTPANETESNSIDKNIVKLDTKKANDSNKKNITPLFSKEYETKVKSNNSVETSEKPLDTEEKVASNMSVETENKTIHETEHSILKEDSIQNQSNISPILPSKKGTLSDTTTVPIIHPFISLEEKENEIEPVNDDVLSNPIDTNKYIKNSSNKRKRKDAFENFDFKPDDNFIETNDNF